MKARLCLTAAVILLLIAPRGGAEEVEGLPLHVQRLNPKVIRVWIGDSISSTATVAFATEKGVVVVDTLGIPKVDAQLRQVIARELGRDDFKVLVNTHEHSDHTGGNGVYADCTIVAHELCGPGMTAQLADRPRIVEWMSNRVPELESELAKLQTGSPEYARLHEDLVLTRMNLETLRSEASATLPTIAFSDRMTMAMGDTTFELYYIGGMHSSSDIAVLVPEHGLLLTGDTMADVWLTDTPGCLASFTARPGVRHDFPLLLANWDRLLARKDQIRDLVPGHWNGDLTLAGFQARVEYVRALWQGINAAAEAGKGMADVFAEYTLATRFPELARSPGFSARNHYSTLVEMWSTVTGQGSAAAKLAELIGAGAPPEAIDEVLEQRGKDGAAYFFAEAEINGHAYGLMGAGRMDQAIAMFRLNVRLYPGSWNAYDSLGEALLRSGETAAATEMYEKSLQLNPDNANGKEVLARIRSGAPLE